MVTSKKESSLYQILEYTEDIVHREKHVPAEKQNYVFKKFLAELPESPCIYLISTKFNINLLKAATQAIKTSADMKGFLVQSYNIAKNHYIEDKRLTRDIQERGEPEIFIIEGVYANTAIQNIDKLRELIEVFDSIPVIVQISGEIGPLFFEDRVFLPYNKFIHFNNVPRKKLRSI